mmetsp:Transcript_281/g.686  ORF Transcript_281/g.686 Transcript_281/m.686 type:complete len:142 (-) Transcript_281:1361-1786(-)
MSFLKKTGKAMADVIPGLGKLTFDDDLGKIFVTSGTGVVGYRVAMSLLEQGQKDVRVSAGVIRCLFHTPNRVRQKEGRKEVSVIRFYQQGTIVVYLSITMFSQYHLFSPHHSLFHDIHNRLEFTKVNVKHRRLPVPAILIS